MLVAVYRSLGGYLFYVFVFRTQKYSYDRYQQLLLKIKSELEFRERRANDILLQQLTTAPTTITSKVAAPQTADERAVPR